MRQEPEENIFYTQQITGLLKRENVPDNDELNKYTDGMGLPLYPVGKYPPNSLGIYDMGLSGAEWINDWYASDYYSYSPVNDPKGPAQGTKKVLRGYIGGDRQYALTMFRQSKLPIPKIDKYDDYKKMELVHSMSSAA